jgi:hypothetical protein
MNSKEKALSHSLLLDLLEYKESTGEFFWKENRRGRGGIKKGDLAGTISDGYKIITINGHKYKAHRIAWFYMTGRWPYPVVDHINRNKLDNRFENLRETTVKENTINGDSYIDGLSTRDINAWTRRYRKIHGRKKYPKSKGTDRQWVEVYKDPA